jgi:polyhydroxybutyrate depolymerase
MSSLGWRPTGSLERHVLEVRGAERSFWLAPPPGPGSPLLVVLHGSGANGKNMAAFTGLAVGGPAAGFTTVFPDARGSSWYCGSSAERREAIGDVAFLEALIGRLGAGGPIFLVGLSNGALFAEQLARSGLTAVAGLALAAGTTLEWCRDATPRPAQAATLLSFQGTADPVAPYAGGPLRAPGLLGVLLRRRRRTWLEPGDARVVGAEAVAGDWAAANGIEVPPSAESLPVSVGDPAVTRLTWSAPSRPSAILYRIEGGGHAWPGGPQYLPRGLVGAVAKDLDAGALVLGTFAGVAAR